MGQYYKACLFKDDCVYRVFSPWHYGNGQKLMEHSYIENDYVNLILAYLKKNGPCNIAWVGDYSSDVIEYRYNTPELRTMLWMMYITAWHESIEYEVRENSKDFPKEIYNSYAEIEWGPSKINKFTGYVINLTKNEAFELPKHTFEELDDDPIHPLPLLTSTSNGLGGGDYSGTHMDLIGTWAGDLIDYVPYDMWDEYKTTIKHPLIIREMNFTEDGCY